MRDGEDVKDPKYINSRETLLFSKSRVLFGLDQARPTVLEQGCVVLVEGYLDVILAHQRGVTAAVAALGTSVTADHARALARLAEAAILFLDSDDAGLRAAQRGAPLLLAEKMDVRVLVPRGVKDPGDYFAAGAGREEFERLLTEHSQPALEFLLDRAGRREASSIEDRIQVVRRLGAMADGIADPLVRSACARGVARALDLPEEGVAAEIFPRAARRFARGTVGAIGAESDPVGSAMHGSESNVVLDPKASPHDSAANRAQVVAEEELLIALLHEPSLRPAAVRLLHAGAIVNVARARLFVALVEDPQLPATAVVERVLGDSSIETEAQQTLLDLVHRPASADPGKLFDGALRWFERQHQKRAGEKIAESYRVGLARGEAGDAVEFLRRFEEARRARSCETGD
jgi:DNA primase